MTEQTNVRFENNRIRKIKASREYLLKVIATSLLVILGLYVFTIYGRRGQHLDLAFKIALPTIILLGLGIYFASTNLVTAITFDKLERQITIEYYKFFKHKSISFAYNKFKYEVEENRTSLYSSNKIRSLRFTLYNHMTFLITSDSSADEGMDFNSILELVKEVKKK